VNITPDRAHMIYNSNQDDIDKRTSGRLRSMVRRNPLEMR
jgi:hypothetical protein